MGNYFISNGELYHYGVKGMKWGVRRAKIDTTQLKRAYKKDAEDAKKAYKTYVESMPKIFLGIRDGNFADKKAKKAYEESSTKATNSRYEYELARSKNRGKATRQLIIISGKREYDRIYDKLSDTNIHADTIHKKAQAGQRIVEEILRKQDFSL